MVGAVLLMLAAIVLPVLPVAATEPATIAIRGELTYRERVALPDDAVAVVGIRDALAPEDASALAEWREPLRGRQVPVAFELALDRDRIAVGGRYHLRGGILVDGRPAWATRPVAVDTGADAVDVGQLLLARYEPIGFSSEFRCGELAVTVGAIDDGIRLRVGGGTFELRQTPAASGARYTDGGGPGTRFWSKGEQASIVVRGEHYPECTPAAPAERVFRARGNEPGWSLVIDEAGLELDTGYGVRRHAAQDWTVEQRQDGRTYRADAAGTAVVVTVTDRICEDNMTGMPHPVTVTVELGDEQLAGCGGEPASLLHGPEWMVTTIDGAPLVAGSEVTIAFTPQGGVAGKGSCNRYTGTMQLSGEAITMGPIASTMMACVEPLMDQEQHFLGVLAEVRSFAIAPDGALSLRAADGREIVARRA